MCKHTDRDGTPFPQMSIEVTVKDERGTVVDREVSFRGCPPCFARFADMLHRGMRDVRRQERQEGMHTARQQELRSVYRQGLLQRGA